MSFPRSTKSCQTGSRKKPMSQIWWTNAVHCFDSDSQEKGFRWNSMAGASSKNCFCGGGRWCSTEKSCKMGLFLGVIGRGRVVLNNIACRHQSTSYRSAWEIEWCEVRRSSVSCSNYDVFPYVISEREKRKVFIHRSSSENRVHPTLQRKSYQNRQWQEARLHPSFSDMYSAIFGEQHVHSRNHFGAFCYEAWKRLWLPWSMGEKALQ